MQYYREYLEVTDDPGGCHVVEIRMCHEFPAMPPTNENRVVVFDDRVVMTEAWSGRDMPTDAWQAMPC